MTSGMIALLAVGSVVGYLILGILCRPLVRRVDDTMVGFGKGDDDLFWVGMAVLLAPLFVLVFVLGAAPFYALGWAIHRREQVRYPNE